MVKKKPKFGAVPTLNLPTRSHDIAPKPTRPARSIASDDVNTAATSIRRYKSFGDFFSRIKTLKTITNWLVEELDDRILLKKGFHLMLPEIQVMIYDSLGFPISVYGWLLPEDHELYSECFRSVANFTVSDLVKKTEAMSICPGVNHTAYQVRFNIMSFQSLLISYLMMKNLLLAPSQIRISRGPGNV